MAAGMLTAIENGSLGCARDDGVGEADESVGMPRAREALIMPLRGISIRRFGGPFSKGLLM